MTAKYFAILTSQGAAKLANATALGTRLHLTQMAVGDGNGALPTPDPAQTRLVNQKRIASLNMLSVDPQNSSQLIAEQIIPENEGGFWIREIGLYDDTGVLIAVANCPETYKPQLQEGSGRTQTIRMILIVSNTDAVTLKIDPAVVLATRKYVDDKVIEVKAYADNLMAAHLAAANPHNQYAPKDSPALTGKPTAPTAAQASNDTQLATTAFVKAALAALVDSSPAALDTLNELAAALGDDPNFAATMATELSKKMDKARNGADIPDVAAFLANLGLDRLQQTAGGTTLSSANKSTFLFIDPDKWGVFDGSKNVALAIDAGGTGADTVDGALKNLGLDTALADKQTKDTTLTALSGKTVAQLLAYLTLGPIASAADITAGTANKLIDAYGLNAYFPARGFSAYGYIRIPNQPGGLILQWGQVPPIPAGGSLIVNYTMAFPGGFLTVIPMAGSSPAAANAVLAAGGGDSKSSFQVFNSLPGVTHETGSGIYLALGF